MAEILRGRYKDKRVTIRDWCNDWTALKETPDIVGITNLKLTLEESAMILMNDSNGILEQRFEFKKDRFVRRRRRNRIY